jgi:hypothetical protein
MMQIVPAAAIVSIIQGSRYHSSFFVRSSAAEKMCTHTPYAMSALAHSSHLIIGLGAGREGGSEHGADDDRRGDVVARDHQEERSTDKDRHERDGSEQRRRSRSRSRSGDRGRNAGSEEPKRDNSDAGSGSKVSVLSESACVHACMQARAGIVDFIVITIVKKKKLSMGNHATRLLSVHQYLFSPYHSSENNSKAKKKWKHSAQDFSFCPKKFNPPRFPSVGHLHGTNLAHILSCSLVCARC